MANVTITLVAKSQETTALLLTLDLDYYVPEHLLGQEVINTMAVNANL